MAQDFNVPPAGPVQEFPAPAEPPKRNNTTMWIIIAVVIVLLCCCCLAAILVYFYQNGDRIFNIYPQGLVPLLQGWL